MNMKTAFAVFSLIGGLVACGFSTEETTTGTTTATGTTYTTTPTTTTTTTTPTSTTSTTPTTSTTTTTPPTPAAYTMYEGWETMDYDAADFGYAEFAMRWAVSGTPLSVDSSCTNCEFMFAVTGTVDAAASTETYDYFNTDYGYSSNFDGQGESWVMNYYGTYYWWGYATLTEMDGSSPSNAYRFNYWYGSVDEPITYGGVAGYYTYYQFGNVNVQ